ncbi:MAG: hypothetical protein IPN84_03735 [Sphingomonadales bacterium]|nr:hypothetical protein [Sphingomonadales bacterium]
MWISLPELWRLSNPELPTSPGAARGGMEIWRLAGIPAQEASDSASLNRALRSYLYVLHTRKSG